jgi:hypothetical protein
MLPLVSFPMSGKPATILQERAQILHEESHVESERAPDLLPPEFQIQRTSL